MTANLEELAQRLLDAARTAGADASDALAVDGTSISIDVRDGKLEAAERSEGIDIGLRVLIGQRQACVSASDISDTTISAMAERAVAMAREAPEDPYIGLADPGELANDWDLAALDLVDQSELPAPEDLQLAAKRAESAALKVAGVTKIDAAGAAWGQRQIHLATSNGFSGGYARGSHSLSCVAIAGDGLEMERDYYGDGRVHAEDLESPETIGLKAGQRAVSRFGARKPPTGAYPVIFDERVSSSLVGHLLMAVNGTAIARGSSWLRDALGELVLPNDLSITEDPLRPRVAGSRPFDAEGLRTRRRDIIKDGILQGWTLDLATGRNLGMESSGNATRGTSAPPSPGVSNIAMTEGKVTREELMADIGTGLLVTSLIGSSINPTTGDYSRGASGFWIENGEIAYPVNECTLAGNLREMLRSIVPANDGRPHLTRVVPSVLVEGLTLAGE